MKGGTLAVVGDVAVDYVLELAEAPSADEKVSALASHRTLGGTAANAAVVAAALGSAVTLISAVGEDPDGTWVATELVRRGISTAGVTKTPGRTTFATILLRGPHREVIVDLGALPQPSPDALHQIGQCDLAYVSYSPRYIVALVDAGFGSSTVAGIEDWMIGDDTVRAALDHCQLIITNAAGWAAMAAHGFRPATTVLETQGSAGVAVHYPDGSSVRWPAYAVTAVDATGAGDCFAATVCHYLAAGMSLDDAVERGIIAAALATTAVGAQGRLPNADELEDLLHTSD